MKGALSGELMVKGSLPVVDAYVAERMKGCSPASGWLGWSGILRCEFAAFVFEKKAGARSDDADYW